MSGRGRKVSKWPVSRAFSIAAMLLFSFGSFMALHGTAPAKDPGVRGGAAGAGEALPGMTPDQTAFFNAGLAFFNETISVQGTDPGTRLGLGPIFNSNSCQSCHSQPAAGGSTPLQSVENPEIAAANVDGAINTIPPFITQGGPAREARFVFLDDGVTPDGGVHDLFTITGRSDAGSCSISQPDFAGELAKNNVIFRIPTPVFGDGLLEMVHDQDIVNQQTYECTNKKFPGICGVANPSPNGGTLSRFGWKAQNPSMLVFGSEASNVETGVTNELFPNERNDTTGCQFNTIPESQTTFSQSAAGENIPSDIMNLSTFMRMLAQPVPGACPGGNSASCTNGMLMFERVGCALCHNPSYITPTNTSVGAMGGVTANVFSDLLVHHMGPGLADCVTQGAATGDMFRTAPLWGVGQRVFFLHDGRTSDILQAIEEHMSSAGAAACGMTFGDSEANPVIEKFNTLSPKNQQDVLNFLRSL